MESRRDFLKAATAIAAGTWPAAVRRALAIEPDPGTTVRDAEHVVILMQENRSFDHTYGSLRGVRGFNDPRAAVLPNGNPVWLQSNAKGETYAPFRLDLKGSRSTWMGCLPHGWADQQKAWNHGDHDGWLDHKASGNKEYAALPLTLGYHNREDLPFYYALADAFTICDQNFCSSLTGTTPNRLHLWSGTIRAGADPQLKPHVSNSEADLDSLVSWTTFPERLEALGISWAVYQNELTVPTGLDREQESWLANFGDNPLEYFTQYGVHLHERHLHHLEAEETRLASKNPLSEKDLKALEAIREARKRWNKEAAAKRSDLERTLHRRAFITNEGDPRYRDLESVGYRDGETERSLNVPRGDVLHQFRKDVEGGSLPTVSWLVAPQVFSDHPDSPWYGAWYLAEAMDILTRNPEVWKKTVFILCYDENDGYFDHVPPFVPPDPSDPRSGKTSEGLRPELDRVTDHPVHDGPIGLGYRVPLVIASSWSRGGYVCSEVFDHTSILRFLEEFLSHKTGRPVREPNITPWRRAVCGNLMSVFRPAVGDESVSLGHRERDAFLASIHAAKFRPRPDPGRPLTEAEIEAARNPARRLSSLPRQEAGTRPACALPYELAADGILSEDRSRFQITFAAATSLFGDRAAGAPFRVTATGLDPKNGGRVRHYAVNAGASLVDDWNPDDFADGLYQLRVDGPNGFFREFAGNRQDPVIELTLNASLSKGQPDGNATLVLASKSPTPLVIRIEDQAYGTSPVEVALEPGATLHHSLELQASGSWYDIRVTIAGATSFSRRFAGHIETGRESRSDPLMAKSE
jgi:phospholipase C